MISLPESIGMNIRNQIDLYRKKNGIAEPNEVKKLYNKQTNFLEDEFKYVSKLTISEDIVELLDFFPNLTSINIEDSSISNSEIIDILNKYPNITELRIANEYKLQSLNLSKLTNLKSLQLISNKSLINIEGLDKLDLYNLSFYGNESFPDSKVNKLLEDIYKKGSIGLTEYNLDSLYITNFIDYINENNLSIDDIKDNIKWTELLKYGLTNGNDKISYTTNEMLEVYYKARDVIDTYIDKNDSDIEKFSIIYEWMLNNITYDFDALDNNYQSSKEGIAVGRKNGTNSSLNGLLYGKAICQGYTKAAQLLLKLADIKSYDIGCIAENTGKNDNITIDGKKYDESDHSIIKVNLDGKIFYSDITWDAYRYQHNTETAYFLLSKKDMSKNHILSSEKNVEDYGISIPKDLEKDLILFANNRINSTKHYSSYPIISREIECQEIDDNNYNSFLKK